MNVRRLAWLWMPVVIYMAAIFYQSSLSDVSGTDDIPDFYLHRIGYAGLALTTLRATAGGRWTGVTLRAAALAWFITTTYGVTDEWHQRFTPGRSAEIRDVGNDAVGALAAVGLAGAWGIMKRNSHVL
jgi:VanZ family protein